MDPRIAPPEGWVQSSPRELPAPNHCPVALPLQSLWQEMGTKGWRGRRTWWASFGGGQGVQGKGDGLGAGWL